MAATSSPTSNQDNSDATFMPVVDTKFCFNSSTTFDVRKQPPVLRCSRQDIVIQVDRVEKFKLEELALPEKGLALKDSKGNPILTVKPEGTKQWNVFRTMKGGLHALRLFTVNTSRDYSEIKVPGTDYKIEGSFVDRIFTIFDISPGISQSERIIAAEVKLNNQVGDKKIDSVYNVEVKTGYDQAFIFGLVAVFEQIPKK